MVTQLIHIPAAQQINAMQPEYAVAVEIERMHQFVAGWFRGEYEQAAFTQGFEDALHRDFERITPSGLVVDRDAQIEMLANANGTSPFFRIATSDIRLIASYPDLLVAGCIEKQSGARNSEQVNLRRVTILLTPGPRLRWLRVHETPASN